MSNSTPPAKHVNAKSDKINQNESRIQVSRSEVHSGPLPHPDTLAKYNEILPGSAERIIQMAEKEQGHRQRMEYVSTRNAIIMSYLGVGCAFLSVIIMAILVFYALSRGYDTTAGALGVGAIASVAGIFIFFKKSSSRKDEEE